MRPNPTLSPEAIRKVRDLVAPRPEPKADDASILLLALGSANDAQRLSCARALLAAPAARDRLRSARARLRGDTSKAGDWVDALVERSCEVASQVDRLLAEGRWSDGWTIVRRELPSFRAAWEAAASMGEHRAVETLARALLPALMEGGEREAFASLAAASHRAAQAIPAPLLRSFTLSYEGAEASLRGDSEGARRFWTVRLDDVRREGNRVAEADTLLDLAGRAREDGDLEKCRSLLAEAEPVVAEIARPDYTADLWCHRTLFSVDEGRLAEAAEQASRALARLEGTDGARVGAFVRLVAARTLAAAGREGEAVGALADLLERCVESGRPVVAARALADAATILEGRDAIALARRALAVAVEALREIGARGLNEAASRLAGFEAAHPLPPRATASPWHEEATGIVAELRESRGAVGAAR